MFGFLFAGAALAGSVFVNGVNVDALRNQTFKNVTAVTLDADGNVIIDAPGYEIQVVAPADTTTASVGTTSPAGGTTAGATTPAPSAVPANQWWLVTEDNGSNGHVITVYINDALVRTVPSGQPQLIADLASFLRPGTNRVRVESQSSGATGGTFYIYLGSGHNESGTVVMDPPQVQFGVGPTREGPYLREYELKIPG